MMDINGDTDNHEIWLYYTSGTVWASIVFGLFALTECRKRRPSGDANAAASSKEGGNPSKLCGYGRWKLELPPGLVCRKV